MKSYYFTSLLTWSFWRHSLFSKGAVAAFLKSVGALWLFIEMLDFFGAYTKDRYSNLALPVILAFSLIYAVTSRRPVRRVTYKVPKRDFSFEVRVGDLLKADGEIVISTNTTFDTDVANGLIAADSLQGQFLLQYFLGSANELDRQIDNSLKNEKSERDESKKGKKQVYDIGTVATVKAGGKNFYLLAMSEMNEFGNASSTLRMIDDSLTKLWRYMADRGELGEIVMPILGTGRGRVNISRKKMIERIAQSFADASMERMFAKKLTIVVYPADAVAHGVNLFEIRDYLGQSLQV